MQVGRLEKVKQKYDDTVVTVYCSHIILHNIDYVNKL